MHKYSIQPVAISADLLPILADFSCGVEAMDEILHSQGILSYEKYGFFYSSRSGQDAARMFYMLNAI